MSLSYNYVDLYGKYCEEIDSIQKNLKEFKKKKTKAIRKGICASEKEVYDLEAQLMGEPSTEIGKIIEETEEDSEYIESQKEEIAKNKHLADVLTFLEDTEEDKLRELRENDMVQIYNFSNGDVYIGSLEEGRLTGTGSYIFSPIEGEEINTEYIGNFVNGVRDGKGEFQFSNGNLYVGNFKNNKSNGIGRMRYSNGDEYLGNWIEGKKEGVGVYTWSNGYIYVGDFRDSKMDGRGACFNEKGELVYDGDWKLGQIHGHGKYIWSKQKYYIGEFQQGQKHGEGIFYIEDVPIYDGEWKFDKPSIFNRTFEDIFGEFM